MKSFIIGLTLIGLVGCAGFNFGVVDPTTGRSYSCTEIDGVSKCSYKDEQGREIFIEIPIMNQEKSE